MKLDPFLLLPWVQDHANQGNGPSYDADLAWTGTQLHVVFTSSALNLVGGDTNAARDIFLRTRGGTCTWLPLLTRP